VPSRYKFATARDAIFGYRLSAIGYRLLAIGYRLLAIGYWLLAIGYPQCASSCLQRSSHLPALSALGRGPGSGPIHPISPSIPMQILAASKYPTPRNGPLSLEDTETRRLAYAGADREPRESRHCCRSSDLRLLTASPSPRPAASGAARWIRHVFLLPFETGQFITRLRPGISFSTFWSRGGGNSGYRWHNRTDCGI